MMTDNHSAPSEPIVEDDKKIVKQELFDINMMEALASHDGVSVDTKKMLKSYKRKREDGNVVQVVYEYGKSMRKLKKGRMYPQKGLGLQNFPSDIRSALAQKYYWDIDMVNSQPVILAYLCEQNGWKCDRLKEYVMNRSAVLSTIMDYLDCDRDTAKNMCIAVMFGGTFKRCPPFIKEMTQELQKIGANIVQAYPEILKEYKNQPNSASSCVALVLQDMEFKILLSIDTFMKSKGRSFDVYIHDGGLIRKVDNELEFPPTLLRDAEQFVKQQFDIDITLAVKPMSHSFEFKKDLMRSQHVSEKEYQQRKELFEETHFYCVETDTICSINPKGLTHTAKSSANVAFSKYNFVKNINNKVCITEFMTEWLKDPMKRTVQQLVFEPDQSKDLSDDVHNTFHGLESSLYRGEVQKEKQIIERYCELLMLNAGKDDVMYDYMLKWFALSVQRPHVVPGVALILINTNQGTGKDTLAEFHGSQVIGKEYYKNIKNVETELFDTHSTAFDRTLFLKLEEVNGSLNRKFSDMLKAMITSTTATINPKGMKKYTINAFPHLLMTTNNAVPVKVESSDRRFCISYTSSDRMGDRHFWNETYDLFALPCAGRVVYDYLQSVDLSTFQVANFPRSEYHKTLSETEETSEVQFMKQCEPFNDMKSTILYEQYQSYCTSNKLVAKGIVHFARSLAPLIEVGIMSKRVLHGVNVYSKI
jgi:hypothetical protein